MGIGIFSEILNRMRKKILNLSKEKSVVFILLGGNTNFTIFFKHAVSIIASRKRKVSHLILGYFEKIFTYKTQDMTVLKISKVLSFNVIYNINNNHRHTQK